MLDFASLPSPNQVIDKLKAPSHALKTVHHAKEIIVQILFGQDKRKLLILGPCSIHDPSSALHYASLLKELAYEVQDTFFIVMRVYFSKPRTTAGWKGWVNDPRLDGSHKIEEGIWEARTLLLAILEQGIPAGAEMLDPFLHLYLNDLYSWMAIGACTVESQPHRELASSLLAPVGFKNNTAGHIQAAIHGIQVSKNPHHFLGIDPNGRTAILKSQGNPYGHLILRGGHHGPNYSTAHLQQAEQALTTAGLSKSILIDCSHGNCSKNYTRQIQVLQDCIAQIRSGYSSIKGLMMESHLYGGKQSICPNLQYGISVTDPCLGFDQTARAVLEARTELKQHL